MADKKKTDDNCKALIQFCANYTALLSDQVVSIRGNMQEAVVEIMASVSAISDATNAKKNEAESMLEQTYFAPDDETKAALGSIQDSVDAVLEGARAAMASGGDASDGMAKHGHVDDGKVGKITSRLASGMKNLDQLDNDVKETLMRMMGALSADDLIAQKMEHVVNSLHGLQVSLSYILLDIGRRLEDEWVIKLQNDLNNYTLAQYTTEEEKQQFFKYFPNLKKSA